MYCVRERQPGPRVLQPQSPALVYDEQKIRQLSEDIITGNPPESLPSDVRSRVLPFLFMAMKEFEAGGHQEEADHVYNEIQKLKLRNGNRMRTRGLESRTMDLLSEEDDILRAQTEELFWEKEDEIREKQKRDEFTELELKYSQLKRKAKGEQDSTEKIKKLKAQYREAQESLELEWYCKDTQFERERQTKLRHGIRS